MNLLPRILIVLLIAGLFITGCKKPVIKGKGLLPSEDDISAQVKEYEVNASTVREDSLITNKLPNNVVGHMEDYVFGKSDAGIYTQINLAGANIDFGTSPTIDSIVLYLDLTGHYGDTTVPQTFKVYQMTQLLPADKSNDSLYYYSFQQFTTGNEIDDAAGNTHPITRDSMTIAATGAKIPPSLHLRLTNTFGQYLLLHPAAFVNSQDFLNTINGIYITADSTQGNAVYYVNLTSTYSFLNIYYHHANDTLEHVLDKLNFQDIVRVNHYSHNNYVDADMKLQNALLPSDTGSDTLAFVQSMAGVKALLQFPAIDTLKNVVINKAELILTAVKSYSNPDSVYNYPALLTLLRREDDGSSGLVEDILDGASYFGGKKMTVTENGIDQIEYHFNLARHIQFLVDGNSSYGGNNGVYVLTYPSTRIGSRVVIGGSNPSHYKARLMVTYTKIP